MMINLTLMWLSVKSFFYILFRSLLKSFLRKTTKLCELQRICYGAETGARRTHAAEYSMLMSRSSVLQRIDSELTKVAQNSLISTEWQLFEKAIEATCIAKRINLKIHLDFVPAYRECLVQIYGYKQLCAQISSLRAIPYDSSDLIHVAKLKKLWENLMDVPLSGMVSKQWSDIGFQGDDPSTDFRGMGLLGLENLIYFSSNYRDAARHILQHSSHPVYGFPFAITGINLTHLALNLLIDGHLKTHFYNAHFRVYTKDDFHSIYCYLFVAFDKLWLSSRPQSVMEFRHIRNTFEAALIEKLSDYKTILKWDPQVETL